MIVDFSNVKFSYSNQSEKPIKPILHIPSWSISPGEQIFIHGPSGSGKSTLLNLMSGMLHASSGSIRILGQELNSMSNRAIDQFRANHIGHVFQQFNLIPYLNAIENIQLARYFCSNKKSNLLNEETRLLLSTLNIDPQNWHAPTSYLSIGQQQRVAIARALINKPKLLIADEPTSSLDHRNRDLFMNLLMTMAKDNNMTLVFVSHDFALSNFFNRVESLDTLNQAHSNQDKASPSCF